MMNDIKSYYSHAYTHTQLTRDNYDDKDYGDDYDDEYCEYDEWQEIDDARRGRELNN